MRYTLHKVNKAQVDELTYIRVLFYDEGNVYFLRHRRHFGR